MPDPLEPSTFRSAVIDWPMRNTQAGAKRLALVRELLTIRRREIAPRLAGARFGEAHAADDGVLIAHWRMGDGATLRLTANLSSNEVAHAAAHATGSSIWGGDPGDRLRPWSVYWRMGG